VNLCKDKGNQTWVEKNSTGGGKHGEEQNLGKRATAPKREGGKVELGCKGPFRKIKKGKFGGDAKKAKSSVGCGKEGWSALVEGGLTGGERSENPPGE